MSVKTLKILLLILLSGNKIGYSEIQLPTNDQKLSEEMNPIAKAIMDGTAGQIRAQVVRSSPSNQKKDLKPFVKSKVDNYQTSNPGSVNHSQDENINKGSTYGYRKTSTVNSIDSVEKEFEIETVSVNPPPPKSKTSEKFSLPLVLILTFSICTALCVCVVCYLFLYHRNPRRDDEISLTSIDTASTTSSAANGISFEFSHPSLASLPFDPCPPYKPFFRRDSLPTYIEATRGGMTSGYAEETIPHFL